MTCYNTGQPVAHAKVSVRVAVGQPLSQTRDAFTIADENGRFSVAALSDGKYVLQVISEDGQQFGNADTEAGPNPADITVQLLPCRAQIAPVGTAAFP